MRKIFLIDLILVGLLLGWSAFADITYQRIPTEYYIYNPVNFSVSVNEFEELGLSGNYSFWGFYIEDDSGCKWVSQNCVDNLTLSLDVTENLPLGAVRGVTVYGANICGSCGEVYETGVSLEYDEGNTIFIVEETPPPPPPFVEIDENFVAGFLGYVTGIFGSGLTPFVVMIIGIPLAFWVIWKITGLMPKK